MEALRRLLLTLSLFECNSLIPLSHSLILIMGILGSLDAAKSQVECPTWK